MVKQLQSEWRIQPSRLLPFTALGLALVALVWPAFAHAVDVWTTDEEFTYGYLIVPIALALMWWRRHALRRSIGPGRGAGLTIVAAAIALMLISHRTAIHNLAGIA